MRRGHVSIAGGSEVIGALLPARITGIDVTIQMLFNPAQTPQAALRSLDDFSADISLVLGPVVPSEYQILATVSLQLMMRMSRNHPLAGKDLCASLIVDYLYHPVCRVQVCMSCICGANEKR